MTDEWEWMDTTLIFFIYLCSSYYDLKMFGGCLFHISSVVYGPMGNKLGRNNGDRCAIAIPLIISLSRCESGLIPHWQCTSTNKSTFIKFNIEISTLMTNWISSTVSLPCFFLNVSWHTHQPYLCSFPNFQRVPKCPRQRCIQPIALWTGWHPKINRYHF